MSRGRPVATAAIELWFDSARSARPAGDATNRVYRFAESGLTRYLRLVSSTDRSKPQIEAELDFIAFLHRAGVSTVLPVPSRAGRMIEEIPATGSSLFACVFDEAPGERFRYDPTRDNRDHFRRRGRLLGQIHALSRTYIPPGRVRRFEWNEDDLLLRAPEFLPDSEAIVRREFAAMKDRLRDLPRSDDSYGLIHGDLGETNCRCDGDRLIVFDFDDCCYHWFAYDLAIAIYPHGWRPEGLQLLDCLLEGYAEHMPLNVTVADITMFCQWRLLYMFLVHARKTRREGLSAPQAEWFARRRENIARGYTWGSRGLWGR